MARLALASEHLEFFHKFGFLEVDSILEPQALVELRGAVRARLAARTGRGSDHLEDLPIGTLLKAGRDLWRDEKKIKSVACASDLATVNARLSQYDRLRLGFDQAFVAGRHLALMANPRNESLTRTLSEGFSLTDLSSCQPITGGLLINLSEREGEALPEPSEFAPSRDVFTGVPGNGVFIRPDLKIHFRSFLADKDACYHLIVYADPRATYRHNELDWANHAWKDLDYVFGDVLAEDRHPSIRIRR